MESDLEKDWRSTVENNLREWKLQERSLQFEKRSKEALLRVTEATSLRAGRYRGVRNDRGQEVDFNASGKNTLKARLAQIEFDLEVLEQLIGDGEQELVTLPEAAGDDE